MPIYEYQCRDCGHEFEALQKISDQPLTDCPACSTQALYKKVSAAGFRLAGSGWYETDFKKDGQRNLAGKAAEKKADTGSDSAAKPAKAAESKTAPAKTGTGDSA